MKPQFMVNIERKRVVKQKRKEVGTKSPIFCHQKLEHAKPMNHEHHHV